MDEKPHGISTESCLVFQQQQQQQQMKEGSGGHGEIPGQDSNVTGRYMMGLITSEPVIGGRGCEMHGL